MNKTSDSREIPLTSGQNKGLSLNPPHDPFKPHKALFYFLALLLMALLMGMLSLYFKTVYPNRHLPHATEVDQPVKVAPAH